MKICVLGIWHLGNVTAACLSSYDHKVFALDYNKSLIKKLNDLTFPVSEPNLLKIATKSIRKGRLKYMDDPEHLPENLDYLWVTYDTPVNHNDKSDSDFVISNIIKTLDKINYYLPVIISSQLPVGTTKKLELKYKKKFDFIVIPENLRLGNAVNTFFYQKRIIVGLRKNNLKSKIKKLLSPFSKDIKFMRIESAEMTKHAINSFLALSISFANEIASISELINADYNEVEVGLRSEERIGYKAYLSAGAAFAGGTLARDIEFLKLVTSRFKKNNLNIKLINNIKISNNYHKDWVINKIKDINININSKIIAVWGLSYKENSNTLRRSLAVEVGNKLLKKNTKLNVFDPLVKNLPKNWKSKCIKYDNYYESIKNAHILIIFTNSDLYKNIKLSHLTRSNKKLIIIDQNNYLSGVKNIDNHKMISYFTLGKNIK